MAYHSFEDLEVWKRSVDLKTAGGDQKSEVGGPMTAYLKEEGDED
jgi:hypothetical protein